MNVDTFMDNFGHLANAPSGIEKLREMILQLAVQGKLVPQDPNDEPADALLHKIREEKRRMVSEGLLRKHVATTVVANGEQPFHIPASWIWTRLHEAGIINPRNDVNDDLEVSFTPMKLISDQYGEPPKSEPRKWSDVKSGFTHFGENDVVLAKITPCFQNRKSAVMRGLRNGIGAGTTELHVFRPLSGMLLPEYILLFLKSWHFIENGVRKMTGSAGQMRVPKDYFAKCPFPLPPLAEQKRIVAKVGELMALCNELEARQQERKKVHVQLNGAALDRLTSAGGAKELSTAWHRVQNNFDLLYSSSENVKQLRQAILQLAVQGKLVPQDPNDEPASVLQAKLEAKRSQLLQTDSKGTLIPIKPCDPDNAPYPIPKRWTWTRLGIFGLFIGGGTPSKRNTAFWNGSIPWVSPKDMKQWYIDDTRDHVTEGGIEQSSAKLIEHPSLLMVVRGMILAHSFPTAITRREVAINQDMKAIRLALPETSEYLLRACCAEKDRMLVNVERSSHGTCRLSTEAVAQFPIPLPPLKEQKRIVAKVDELMALCDELESKLKQQQTDADQLMNSIVASILNTPKPKTITSPAQPAKKKKEDSQVVLGALSSYIIQQLHDKKTFYRTNHVKLLYLAQSHLDIDLDISFERQAAGPFHESIYDLEKIAKNQRWYSTTKQRSASKKSGDKYKYSPLAKIDEQVAKATDLLAGKQPEMDRLLSLFAGFSSRKAELIATTFSVWNDLLIDGKTPRSPTIVKEFFNWHEIKSKKFDSDNVKEAIQWLRENKLVPQGKGRKTIPLD